MWLGLKFLLITSTLTFLPMVSEQWWKPKETIFFILGLSFLALCWLSEKKERYTFRNRWLGYFFLYIVISFGGHYFLPLVFDKDGIITYNHWNLFPSLNVILAILIVHHLVEYTDTLNRWVSVIKVICILNCLVSLYALSQFLGCDPFIKKVAMEQGANTQLYSMFTFFGNKMLSSNFIACTVPLFLVFRDKKFIAGMFISLGALCLFKSINNLMAATLGISLILALQGRWKTMLIIFTSVLAVIVIFHKHFHFLPQLTSGFSGRLGFWKEVLSKIKPRLWWGYGLGSMPRDFAQRSQGSLYHSSHNILVDILYETGLIGLGIIGGFFVGMLRRLKELFWLRKESKLLIGLMGGLLSWGIMSMGSFPHRIAPLALIGIIYIAGIQTHLSSRRIV